MAQQNLLTNTLIAQNLKYNDTRYLSKGFNEVSQSVEEKVTFTTTRFRLTGIPGGSSQVDAGALKNELWYTLSHPTLPDFVVMIGE